MYETPPDRKLAAHTDALNYSNRDLDLHHHARRDLDRDLDPQRSNDLDSGVVEDGSDDPADSDISAGEGDPRGGGGVGHAWKVGQRSSIEANRDVITIAIPRDELRVDRHGNFGHEDGTTTATTTTATATTPKKTKTRYGGGKKGRLDSQSSTVELMAKSDHNANSTGANFTQ